MAEGEAGAVERELEARGREVAAATGAGPERARFFLEAAGGSVPAAVEMLRAYEAGDGADGGGG